MAVKPAQFPEFAKNDIVDPLTNEPNVTPPDTAHVNEGWQYLNPVTRGYLNWLHRSYDLWIQWLEQEIELLITQVAQNVLDISNIWSTVSDHAIRIAANEINIAANDSNISTNAINIGTNTSNIGTNTTNIGTNTTNIDSNDTDITNIQNDLNFASGTKNFDISNIPSGLETVYYNRVGRNVTLHFANFIGTINAATMFIESFPSIDDFPPNMQPFTLPLWMPCQVFVSGVERLGAMRWDTSKRIQLYYLDVFESGGQYFNRLQPNFPIGQSCGIREQCVTYRTST